MPSKPKIPCSYKGCAALIESGVGGKCEKHKRVENKRYNSSRTDAEINKQYKTSRWLRIRKYVLQRDLGLCQICKDAPAREIDHKIEVKDGGDFWDMDNLQALCHKCHSIKTYEEREKREQDDLIH